MNKKQQIYHNYAGKIFYPSLSPLAAIGGVSNPYSKINTSDYGDQLIQNRKSNNFIFLQNPYDFTIIKNKQIISFSLYN